MKLSVSNSNLTITVLLCAIACGYAFSISIKPSDVWGSVGSIVTGIGSELTNMFPTPKELFEASKYVLFGLPEIGLFKAFNQVCSIAVASDSVEPRIAPKVEEVFFQLRTSCTKVSVPLMETEKLLEHPEFDINKKLVLFITGWMSNIESDYIEDMAKAYHCRGGYNFMAINASDFVQTLYTWSAFNTEEMGRLVATGLVKLATKVPVENIHVIGHSLGAHIAGSAGRYFTQSTNKTLPRITGLDPAHPCFNEGEILTGLYRGDAAFVDVIHSNPDALGKRDPIGDVDFYPGGLTPIKPGCVIFSCSHSRSYEYYIESVRTGYENNFLAKRCNSLKKLNDGYCKGPDVPMGFATPLSVKGAYFLPVNGKAPFGDNANVAAVPVGCGKCNTAP